MLMPPNGPILRVIALVTSVMGLMIVIAAIATQPTMSFSFGKIPSTLAWIISFGAFYYAYSIHGVSLGYLIGLLVLCMVCGVIGTPIDYNRKLLAKLFKRKKQRLSASVEEVEEEPSEDWVDMIQKTFLRIPVRIILVLLAILETVFNSMVLHEGGLKTESWFWDKLFENREKFYDYEEVYGKKVQNDYAEELWIYVNGIKTDLRAAKKNCKQMYKMFGRPVKLLHNPTNGTVLDLMECLMGKVKLDC